MKSLCQSHSPYFTYSGMWYDTDQVIVIWKTKQFQQYGKVERWLEDIWVWMLKFKDAVFGIALEVISF